MKMHAEDIILGPQFPSSLMTNRKLHSSLQMRKSHKYVSYG